MESNGKKILIAEDEADIREIISYHLRLNGFEVYAVANGSDAVSQARAIQPDLVILDIMMPGKSGIEVCRILRKDDRLKEVYILLLTALADDATHIQGLEAGADDFVNKPVSPKVLISRVNALLRRSAKAGNEKIDAGDLVIDPEKFEVMANGQEVLLAKKEFELLYLLASRPGKVFLRQEILSRVWGDEVIVGDRTIDVHIRKIRQKLKVDCITTIKGVGYKFQIN